MSTHQNEKGERMKLSELRQQLYDWHGGQGSGVYSVASTMGVNPKQTGNGVGLTRAVRELRRLLADAKHPEAVTAKDVRDCNRLASELERRYAAEMAKAVEMEQS